MSVPHRLSRMRPFKGEHNDCVVRALAASAGCSYEDAHAACELAGRKRRRGMPMDYCIKNNKIPFFQFEFVLDGQECKNFYVRRTRSGFIQKRRLYPTLAQFLKQFPTGRYLCSMYGHAFAVIDGVVVDDHVNGARTRVRHAWKVTLDGGGNSTVESSVVNRPIRVRVPSVTPNSICQ